MHFQEFFSAFKLAPVISISLSSSLAFSRTLLSRLSTISAVAMVTSIVHSSYCSLFCTGTTTTVIKNKEVLNVYSLFKYQSFHYIFLMWMSISLCFTSTNVGLSLYNVASTLVNTEQVCRRLTLSKLTN